MTSILLLADINSSHTQKWAIGLSNYGFKIGIFSFSAPETDWHTNYNIVCLNKPDPSKHYRNLYDKLGYVILLPKLKKAIREFKPDVLHAHYASSYGLLGAMSGFHPYIISAWGTDVIKFPNKNFLTKQIIKFNLRKADSVCATSHTLERYIQHIISKKVEVIPFGVDMEKFKQANKIIVSNNTFTIGCVKSLEKIYNIDLAIVAFSKLKLKYPNRKMKLIIVGEGSERKKLEDLVFDLNLSNDVVFEGKLSHTEIANKINELDVFVNLSEYESFGVSVVEAMSCQKPVIVSEAEGLIEVVGDDKNGIVVDLHHIDEVVKALERYMLDENLRKVTGENARERVAEIYNWENSMLQMVGVYDSLIKKRLSFEQPL